MASKKRSLPTQKKAKKILRDDTTQGKPLTDKQRGFFGAVAGGNVKPSKLKKK